MEISLIISTFNRKDLLLPLLYILEKQSLKNFEVIVADDGSTDGTPEEVKKIMNKLSYDLQIVSQGNIGFRVASSRIMGPGLPGQDSWFLWMMTVDLMKYFWRVITGLFQKTTY